MRRLVEYYLTRYAQYAVTVGDGITLPEARQRTKDQAIFLLSHFPKDTEFHNWLTQEFPVSLFHTDDLAATISYDLT